MISLHKISVNFTGDDLFKDLSFVVGDKERVGLVGKNGAGKSTLLKIIHRELLPETGTITLTAGFRTGYLPQEIAEDYTTTVKAETMKAFEELKSLESKINHLTTMLTDRKDFHTNTYIDMAQQLADATDRFHRLGGHTMEGDTEKVLCGLGFKPADFSRPLSEFSSGWQMRVNLAKILLQQPEIILLDEPTNHLDIESIQWLEDYLANFGGCLILVSHDRAFLDRVTTRTIEITFGTIQDYKCNYSGYVEQRLARVESQQNAYENQQKQIADIERFIERFRYKATKAKQVQSRVKLLDKMEKIEVENVDTSSIHFRFPPAPHSGKITVASEQLTLGYGNLTVLKDIDFQLERGERVAFVGRNGEGKSTLVKAIAGELVPRNGTICSGHQVVIGYYAQNQALLLDPNKTVIETIDEVAVGDTRPKIRSILGSFLFSTEDIEKKVKVLSGGEKSRLALAKLLLSPFNLLILDEPTNHLDMSSKDVLKNALLQYEGTLVLVSHDRDFLQGLTQKVIEFKDQHIKTYLGDVYDFLEKKKMNTLHELQQGEHDNGLSNKIVSLQKETWEKRKEEEARARKTQNKINKLEKEITGLQQQLQDLEKRMSYPEHYEESGMGGIFEQYEALKQAIADKEDEWLLLLN
ncbi:MAG: ABC-F family ATP-binding cassette domain-containing protein [Bacteroidales bacterium]|jgi:ATP-binding cassette subfamily F protein 3|nr:ABC-F family ATP-binding cassette domain-containing protein [Bacteroidales bacterium]